jgi:hypothetical protein
VCYYIFNAVDAGTTFDQAWIVRQGVTHGQPSSAECFKAFVNSWTGWAGWPLFIFCDRGMLDRGVLRPARKVRRSALRDSNRRTKFVELNAEEMLSKRRR